MRGAHQKKFIGRGEGGGGRADREAIYNLSVILTTTKIMS